MNEPKFYVICGDKTIDQIVGNFENLNGREVTCNELWRNWVDFTPEDPLAVEAKERIAKLTKEDWKIMAAEAVEITEALADLVRNNIPMDSPIVEKAFNDLMEHTRKWFFTPNQTWLMHVAMLTADKRTKFYYFFNKFHPGLSEYLSQAVFVNKFASSVESVVKMP